MLFSEVYGVYFQTVAAILTQAAAAPLTPGQLNEIVREKAFSESALAIPRALRSGEWPLLDDTLRPVLLHEPSLPLTLLERRWLKALLADARIALFEPDTAGLEDVEPLFAPDVFVRFDQYADGDPYTDPVYVACFRTVLQALREKRRLRIRFRGKNERVHSFVCIPHHLEYSAKDDKFRLLASGKRTRNWINLGRVISCELLETPPSFPAEPPCADTQELVVLLHDERNALERVLLHFSHLEKETRKLDDRLFEIRLRYDRGDETELLIRVLSFGPVLEVKAPDRFIGLVRERIRRQKEQTPGFF